MRRIALLVLVSACGRLWFDPLGVAGAGPDDHDGGAIGDAMADAAEPACTTFGPWSAPVEVTELTSGGDDWEPALHPDGNTLVFVRGITDLYVATRSGMTFGTPVQMAATPNVNYGPSWSPTGDQLYFSSDATGNFRLHVADFVAGTLQSPTLIPELANEDMVAPAVSPDGLELYYSRTNIGARIRRATRTSLSSPWVLEGVLSQLTVGNEVGWPALSPDGLTLYFEMIDGAGAKIYMATRASKADAFENPTLVPGLITGNIVEVGDPDISRDGTTMFLSARRMSSPTGFDIFVSTRSCL